MSGAINATTAFSSEHAADLVSDMSKTSSEFQKQVEAIDATVLSLAQNAFGDNDDAYRAFEAKYKEVMKPKAEEMSETLASHASKAQQMEEAGAEMAAYNEKVINNS